MELLKVRFSALTHNGDLAEKLIVKHHRAFSSPITIFLV